MNPRRLFARRTFDLMCFSPVSASGAVQTLTGRRGRRAEETEPGCAQGMGGGMRNISDVAPAAVYTVVSL